MNRLTVLYDAGCSLCCRIRTWLAGQPKYVELEFVPLGSEEALRRFPALDHGRTATELTVIGDDGSVYQGAKGWLMCLWALREYREWSFTLSSPELMPLAQRFIIWVSQNRAWLGSAAGLPQACNGDACNPLLHTDCDS